MISAGEALDLVRNREDTDARIIRDFANELLEVQGRARRDSEELSRIRGLMHAQGVWVRAFGGYDESRSYALCWEGTSIRLESLRKVGQPT
jgi:hypothetical protein